MLSEISQSAILLSVQLALTSIIILLIIGTPLAWWLARTSWRYKTIIEAFIALPLVLPPTVIGFYLLLAFSPNSALANLLQWFGIESLNFTFSGLVVGSVIYSLPFVIQPLQQSFHGISQNHLDVAATLGAKSFDRFFSVILPMAKRGYLTASVLGFAHTLGEFGVVLMIGGNIPGKTQVLSIAIYEQVETLQYSQAHWLSGGLLITSFVMLVLVYGINRQFSMVKQ